MRTTESTPAPDTTGWGGGRRPGGSGGRRGHIHVALGLLACLGLLVCVGFGLVATGCGSAPERDPLTDEQKKTLEPMWQQFVERDREWPASRERWLAMNEAARNTLVENMIRYMSDRYQENDLEEAKLEILVQSPFFDSQGVFSPDGQWVAYVSSDSGTLEVFLVPRSGTAGRFQVSTAGGLHPEWSPDGNKLYYVNPWLELMEVDVSLDGAVEIGIPQKVFDIRHQFNNNRPFQVMPDGESFLTLQLEQEIRGGHLTLIQNWEAMLRDR